ALGVLTRYSLAICCCSYLLFEFPFCSIQKPYVNNIVFFVFFILTFSPGVARFSIDQWMKKSSSETYVYSMGWAFRAIKLTLGLIYLNAFVSKIVNSGWSWAFDGHFQNYHLNRLTLN